MTKRLLIVASLILFGAGAVVFYYWQQATQLPSWYTEQATAQNSNSTQPAESSQAIAAAGQAETASNAATRSSSSPSLETEIAKRIQQAPDPQNVQVELARSDVNNLFAAAIQRKAAESKLVQAVKGVNTTVENGRIESGAVVNLGAVPIEQLPANEKAVLDKLVTTFPELARRSVYIGMTGKPSVQNGQVRLSDDTRIQLGNLSFTPAELSQRLGIPEDQIRQRLALEIQLGRLRANDVELVGDKIVIQGSAE